MRIPKPVCLFAVFFVVLGLNSCGGGLMTAPPAPQANTGTVAVLGTDAPLPNIVAFRVTLTGLTVSDGTNTVSLVPGPQQIEFSRLNGLRSLLNLQGVPAGTYTSLTAALAAPVISVINTSVTPPAVETIAASLVRSTVTLTLAEPLVVTSGSLVALLVDLRLSESVQLDPSGQITGQVDPRFRIRVIAPDAPEAEIDELRGGVVSVNAAENSFVMQGPHGRQLTVAVTDQTRWSEGDSLATLDANTIVAVSGWIQRGSLTLRASDVIVLSRDRFVVGGLITFVRPASGPADDVDLLVRTELPDLTGVRVGEISTFAFDGNERFLIHHLRLPFAPFLFHRAALLPGQRVAIGGAIGTAALDARRVVLFPQGLEGHWVVGSTNGPAFRMRVAGVAGALFGDPVRVVTSEFTRFVNLSGIGGLSGDAPIPLRVVGLVLKDDVTGRPVVIARIVERLVPLR